jgi:hypothetical protein
VTAVENDELSGGRAVVRAAEEVERMSKVDNPSDKIAKWAERMLRRKARGELRFEA